jgi:hypothetical protein
MRQTNPLSTKAFSMPRYMFSLTQHHTQDPSYAPAQFSGACHTLHPAFASLTDACAGAGWGKSHPRTKSQEFNGWHLNIDLPAVLFSIGGGGLCDCQGYLQYAAWDSPSLAGGAKWGPGGWEPAAAVVLNCANVSAG